MNKLLFDKNLNKYIPEESTTSEIFKNDSFESSCSKYQVRSQDIKVSDFNI